MEDIGLLDINNQICLFTLHYIFIPRINYSLQQFLEAWNNHPLSTEQNLSPLQLWISGLCNTLLESDQLNEVAN